MNYSTSIFLINKDVRAIAVSYDKIDMDADTTKMKFQPAYLSGGGVPKGAEIYKTMDQSIKINDFVVVPTNTRHGMTVCKVVAIDVEIDFESDEDCHWIVDNVSMENFEKTRQAEDQAIQAMKAAQVNKKRNELSDTMLANMGDDIPKLEMFNKTPSEAPKTVDEACEPDTAG